MVVMMEEVGGNLFRILRSNYVNIISQYPEGIRFLFRVGLLSDFWNLPGKP